LNKSFLLSPGRRFNRSEILEKARKKKAARGIIFRF